MVKGLEVEAVSGLGLFSDELTKSRALIAQAVSKRERGVLPFEVTDRAWALAAEGRNPLTGAECGKPLGTYEARRRWGDALGVTGSVSTNVWCGLDGGCEVNLYGRPLDPDDADDRFHWETTIDPTGDALAALENAIPNLAPPAPGALGGGGLLGSMGGNKPLQEEDLLEVRVWPADQRDRTKPQDEKNAFPSLTVAQVQTCLTGKDSNVHTLVEVSAAGAITRCEGDPSDARTTSSCMCGQLQRGAIAPWLAGTRWSVSVRIDGRDQTTSDRRFILNGSWRTHLQMVKAPGDKYPRFKVKVEDQSIEAWSTGPVDLATGCFANAFPEPGSFTSLWAVWFDGAGRPTKIVEQKGRPPLAKELAECVSRALRTAQAPCPSRAGLWAMAELYVSARDPNVKEENPFGLDGLLKKKP